MRELISDIAGVLPTCPPGVIGIIVMAVFFTALIILVRWACRPCRRCR